MLVACEFYILEFILCRFCIDSQIYEFFEFFSNIFNLLYMFACLLFFLFILCFIAKNSTLRPQYLTDKNRGFGHK